MRSVRTIVAGATVALFVLGASRVAVAHEIGQTQVTATISQNGRYQLDVVVDPDVLLTKLLVRNRQTPQAAPERMERDRRIAALGSTFVDAVQLTFEGITVQPQFRYLPASALTDFAAAPSVVRLTGAVPAGAQTLRFAYGLAMGAYALNLRLGDSPQQTFWIDGQIGRAHV